MLDFMYYNPTRIVFGRGVENDAGTWIQKTGAKKALMYYGGGSIKKNGLFDAVASSLRKSDIDFVEMGGVQPNTLLSFVRKGVEFCRKEKVDFILAIGGGSVIDSAKCVAAGAVNDNDIWDFFCGKAGPVAKALPVGVVLTLPASGSESNLTAALFNDETLEKRGSHSEAHYPMFALINPETNFTLPPHQTASGCCDILSHLMERYFTNTPNVDFTDRLLEGAMRSILYNAAIAMDHPDDYAARAEINFAGTIAHNGLLGCGREMCFGVHAIELELTAIYDRITHGAGIALLTPAWMRYVHRHNPDRFAQFAVRVMDVDPPFENHDAFADESIRRYEDWCRRLGLAIRLGEVGIGDEQFPEMASKATANTGTVGHYVPLDAAAVQDILRMAL